MIWRSDREQDRLDASAVPQRWVWRCLADTAEELAKKLSNPIASLISVPFQFNWDQGYGSDDGDKAYVNVQPVIPFSLNEDWNLISRTIVPIAYQNDIAGPSGDQFGLGDTTQSLFFSPQAWARRHHLGCRPGVPAADSDRWPAWKQAMGRWPDRRGAEAERPVDRRYPRQPNLVICRRRRSRRGQLHFPSALRLLHHQGCLDLRAQHRKHLQLGGRRMVDSDQF